VARARADGARLTAGLGGTGLAAATAIAVAGEAVEPFDGVVRVLAWSGVAAAAAGVAVAVASAGWVAALLLGAAACVSQTGSSTLDARLVPLAAVLLLVAELVAWSAEARAAAPTGHPWGTRLLVLAGSALAGGGAAALVAAAATAPVGDDLAWAALGAGGLVLVAAVGVALARQAAPGVPSRQPLPVPEGRRLGR
jgi:hypothetical protein